MLIQSRGALGRIQGKGLWEPWGWLGWLPSPGLEGEPWGNPEKSRGRGSPGGWLGWLEPAWLAGKGWLPGWASLGKPLGAIQSLASAHCLAGAGWLD